jgi:E3 ubiquitin-protein ligase MARCH6
VIASFIIVTFLAFMSFADFLRFNWQGEEGGFQARQQQQQQQPPEENHREEWDMAVVQLEVINRMKEYVSRAVSDREDGTYLDVAEDRRYELQQMRDLVRDMERLIHPTPNEVPRTVVREQELQRHEQTRELLQMLEELEADNENKREIASKADLASRALNNSLANVIREQEAEPLEANGIGEEADEAPEAGRIHRRLGQWDRLQRQAPPAPPDNNRFDRFDAPQNAGMNAEEVDMGDINLALDELLGLRGPLSVLIRNVCWLLAFNTTYLGLFAFIPKNVGVSMHSLVLNRTYFADWMYNATATVEDEECLFPKLVGAMNAESERLNTTLRLPDLATITLGYLSLALMVVIIQLGVSFYSKYHKPSLEQAHVETNGRAGARAQRDHQQDGPPRHLDADQPQPIRVNNNQAPGVDEREVEDMIGGLGDQLNVALDCIKALTKVGFLLFHKMLLLPLVLGVWLDYVTLELLGNSLLDRSTYAGSDIFSSALLHWVAGITFMLFVTVSVLQLREVAHPEILARVIRPQEPQPDLLSNLLHESLTTHAKRMLMSFVIYSVLLSLYVALPARILVASGLGQYMPFTRPHFYHMLMPQLQIPLELLVFHLTMLALLEKYKNRIGEMQHHWLVFICTQAGLAEYFLPRYVEKFELIGSHCIFLRNLNVDSDSECDDENEYDENDELAARRKKKALTLEIGRVHPFWYELVSKKDNLDEFFSINLDPLNKPLTYKVGFTRQNGERIPCNMQEVLVLPPNWTQQENPVRGDEPADSHVVTFLPTAIGPYRFARRLSGEKAMVVDIYKEIPGDPVPRPPEGWDDLGIGGAEIQGRWAWGKEKKSTIETGIAARNRVFDRNKSWSYSFGIILKGVMLVVVSWAIVSIATCLALAFPLMVGRTMYSLLRIPDQYVHDPFAFAIGICLWKPAFSLLSALWSGDQSFLVRVFQWASSFVFPPIRKGFVVVLALVLWVLATPLALGLFYDLLLLKGRSFFSGHDTAIDETEILASWATGTMLLNSWALMCYCGVFTRDFWIDVGAAALDAEVHAREHDDGEAPDRDDGGSVVDLPDSTWQGQDGKIGRFVATLTSAIFKWEWDYVDHHVLLTDSSKTVARHVITSLVTPSVAFLAWLFALRLVNQHNSNVVVPFIGEVDNDLYRAIVFRTFAVVTLLAQFAAANRVAMRRWFQAAHRAARDGRYLEGEILLNYDTDNEDH